MQNIKPRQRVFVVCGATQQELLERLAADRLAKLAGDVRAPIAELFEYQAGAGEA